MNHHIVTRTLLGCLFSMATLAAQRDWVVDGQTRPGYDFATVTEALAAAHDGDRILVRYTNYGYQESVWISKAVTVEGVGRPFFMPPGLLVRNIPGSKCVVLRNLEAATFLVTDCAGHVQFEHCGYLYSQSSGRWWVTNSTCVSLDDCQGRGVGNSPAMQTSNSNVTLRGCSLRGGDWQGQPPKGVGGSEGLSVSGGSVVLSRCAVSSGVGGFFWGWPTALSSNSARIVIAGGARTRIATLFGAFNTPPVVANGGTVVFDPRAELLMGEVTQGSIYGSAVVTEFSTDTLHGEVVTSGQSARLTLALESQRAAVNVIFCGLGSAPVALGHGAVWLAAAPLIPIAVVRTRPDGTVSCNIPWSTSFPRHDIAVVFQAISADGQFEPSTPFVLGL